ncbi:universal stress protein [Tateyamaria pelophila]|uniref:universal stress protein n=1 Tax=Tateyamaria pelophila TaxID=328415 RepID=UPI001CC0DF68|nr:universal stress protein [Tateyamaria pelophila]
MYHNILVPVVFDDEYDKTGPVKLAGLLATPDAKVTFLHVVESIPSYAMTYVPADLQKELRVAMDQTIDDLAKRLPGATGEIVEGHSGRTILDYAKEHGVDLIIIASHRPGFQDLLLGSTASHVVRHAACAVHVVR